MGASPVFAYWSYTGCSSRQDAHHEAQTLNSHTCPRRSAGPMCLSGACSSGSEKVGAGLSISGEGTSLGRRLRPIARNTASTTTTPRGRERAPSRPHFRILERGRGGGGRHVGTGLSLFEYLTLLARERAITAIADCEQAAQGHERAAGPD